jgi:proteasome lid subunit RPN8/RPN11
MREVSKGMYANEPPKQRVRFDAAVLQSIRRHARTSMDAEICGVLLGSGTEEYTSVDACIAGENAAHGAAHVTFTQNTWEHIYTIKDRDFPETKIVGWYHSHPGFGVFLSHHDIFIHENFFSAPHQVAWVFDPHSDEEGCFGWADRKIRPLQSFEVVTQVPDTPPRPEPDVVVLAQTVPTELPTEPPEKGLRGVWGRIPIKKRLSVVLIALAGLLAIFTVELILLTRGPGSIRIPSAKQFVERILNMIRPSSPTQSGRIPIGAPLTGDSTFSAPAPTPVPNSVPVAPDQWKEWILDGQAIADIEKTPKPDSPALTTDLPPDTASQ